MYERLRFDFYFGARERGYNMLGFYRKWIKGECRHFCHLCKFKAECLTQLAEEERVKAEITDNKETKKKEQRQLPTEFYTHTVDRFNNIT